jgi:multiple sugar transport system ATP-binding protein
MDEPLSNLDAKLRVSLRAQLTKLHERLGVTTVYVTHDQVEAMTLGTRVAVLRDGVLQQCDTPQELFHRPANLFVAAFIGSPAMNLIEGVVDGEGDQPAARLKDGTAIRIAASRNVKRGQSVTIGLRPEHIGSTVGGDISLSGRTVLVEPTGAQTHVVFELAGDQVTAVVDGEQLVKVNTPFAATVHHERVHVFDRASGLAL